MSRLFISFSGGETSAYMAHWCLTNNEFRSQYGDIVVLMANTTQERPETIEFARRCNEQFGLGIVLVEAVVHHGERRAPSHRVVTLEDLDMSGTAFEEAVRKYGIPNKASPSCTRDLKLRPMESYLRSIGWEPGSYDTAIGIRADEKSRAVIGAAKLKRRIIYPLIDFDPMTKPQINSWWAQQPFRLGLKGYEGNCSWCWKKSLRKHITLIGERPEIYDFPRRIERDYGLVGPEFLKDTSAAPLAPGYRRVFFRGGMSTEDLFAAHGRTDARFVPASDDAQVFDAELDVGGDCEESCEVHVDGQMDLFEEA